MIRPLRRRHRRIWWLLAALLPLALATAIWIRPSVLHGDLPAAVDPPSDMGSADR